MTATAVWAYGGNKTRKLEYLVADALAKGCDTLVSTSASKGVYSAHIHGGCGRVNGIVRGQ